MGFHLSPASRARAPHLFADPVLTNGALGPAMRARPAWQERAGSLPGRRAEFIEGKALLNHPVPLHFWGRIPKKRNDRGCKASPRSGRKRKAHGASRGYRRRVTSASPRSGRKRKAHGASRGYRLRALGQPAKRAEDESPWRKPWVSVASARPAREAGGRITSKYTARRNPPRSSAEAS